MEIIKSGHSSYGDCWVSHEGAYYYVYVGSSKHGPFSNLADALREYSSYCAN